MTPSRRQNVDARADLPGGLPPRWDVIEIAGYVQIGFIESGSTNGV
jgi:hypothetical protein